MLTKQDNINNNSVALSEPEIQFSKTAEVLDLCCIQLISIMKDLESSSGDLTEILFSIINSVSRIEKDSDDINLDKECSLIKKGMQNLTVSYQMNDEICQRISHLEDIFAMLTLLIRSKEVKDLSSEWDFLHRNIIDNRSIKRQHQVFSAAVNNHESANSHADEEDSYELF